MTIRLLRIVSLSLCAACSAAPRVSPPPAASPSQTAVAAPDTASPWESDIRAFEEQDRREMPPPGAVLFVGSSSIRMWETVARDFPEVRTINRGFGGSQLGDVVRYERRIVLPYRPRVVVLYAGDNDLEAGRTPAAVFADFVAFADTLRRALPDTRLVWVAVKPSLARWRIVDRIRATNALVREYVARDPAHLAYADVFTPMLGADGTPRPDIFKDDGLHMNARGYAIWTDVVRPYLR